MNFKRGSFIALIITCFCAGCFNDYLSELPHFKHNDWKPEFKSAPYIEAAIALQKVGQKIACQKMMRLAKADENADQIYILCRMLFIQRNASIFRPPYIGGASYLGMGEDADWPHSPIEVIDGVPFAINWAYTLAGSPETPADYLNYCMTSCDWNTFKYTPKSHDELVRALNKLLITGRWKRPLNLQEKAILLNQI